MTVSATVPCRLVTASVFACTLVFTVCAWVVAAVAVAYVHFAVSIPLLFLALPCAYDYWCIREKVRSDEAVKDVRDLFSVWSSVIAQIAEDRGMASEVSQYETEHAMKNALELAKGLDANYLPGWCGPVSND